MPDTVWSLSTSGIRLGTFNGFGISMMGATREDATGRRFMTRWVVILGLPLLPLGRYYVREMEDSFSAIGTYSETVHRYVIAGRARLRAGEILRTYTYCWVIGPAFVAVPIIVLLSHADGFVDSFGQHITSGVITLIVLFLGWLIGSIIVLVALLDVYRKRWAPLREVRWVGRPPAD